MNRFNLLAAGLLLVCWLPAHAAAVHEQTYVVGADVDANGRVTATQIDDKVPAKLASALASAAQQWQFVPATHDGHPASAHTFIRARVRAVPITGGQYQLSINYIGNGPKLDKAVPPRYPRDAARAREQGFAMLDATVQPDGSLTDMTVRSRFKDWPLPRLLGRSVLAAAEHWHAIPEQVGGQPVATHMHIPVTFTIRGQGFTREQVKILREAARAEPATASAVVDQPAILLPSDQPVALDSPLQPRTVAAYGIVH